MSKQKFLARVGLTIYRGFEASIFKAKAKVKAKKVAFKAKVTRYGKHK